MVGNGIAPTSGLQFLRAASNEILHLLGGDLCPLPCVRPFGLRGDWVDGGGRFRLLLGGIGVFTPKDSRKEGHFWRVHATDIIDVVRRAGDGELRVSLFRVFSWLLLCGLTNN